MEDNMPSSHKFFQDKIILLLIGLNFFLVCATVFVIISRIIANSGSSYISQYRGDVGIGAFTTGSILDFIYFIIFAILVVAFHFSLSLKTYPIRRQLSVVILLMSVFLLIITMIVSNSLLVLR
jgi:hypothetical protein